MADSLPIPARSGVARAPLDPTDVVPGPQPIESAERDGHQVIVGEVLNKGRHRASRPRRKVAVSGAVLSAAGAFVTLALMMSHDPTSASASPRVSPSTPMPDLPDEPTASAHPTPSKAPATHAEAAPGRAASPAPVRRAPATEVRRTITSAEQFRQEAIRSAEAWAGAMRQAQAQYAQQQGTSSSEYRAGTWQQQGTTAYGSRHGHGHGHGHHRGGR